MVLASSMEAKMKQEKPSLPAEGYVRLKQILGPEGPVPVGKSTWYAGVKSGRFPQPVKLGPRTTAWRVADIRALFSSKSDLADAFEECSVTKRRDTTKGRRNEE